MGRSSSCTRCPTPPETWVGICHHRLVASQSLRGPLRILTSFFVFAAHGVARQSIERVVATLTSAFLIHVVIPGVSQIVLAQGIARIGATWTALSQCAVRDETDRHDQERSIGPSHHGLSIQACQSRRYHQIRSTEDDRSPSEALERWKRIRTSVVLSSLVRWQFGNRLYWPVPHVSLPDVPPKVRAPMQLLSRRPKHGYLPLLRLSRA